MISTLLEQYQTESLTLSKVLATAPTDLYVKISPTSSRRTFPNQNWWYSRRRSFSPWREIPRASIPSTRSRGTSGRSSTLKLALRNLRRCNYIMLDDCDILPYQIAHPCVNAISTLAWSAISHYAIGHSGKYLLHPTYLTAHHTHMHTSAESG